jgi:hypothetical protein
MATRETIASEQSKRGADSQSRLARTACVRPDIYTPGIDCWLRGVGVVGIKEKICTSAQLMPSSGCKAISHATTTIAAATSLDKDFQFFCFWSLFYSELTKSFFLFLIFFFLKEILASRRIKSCKVQSTFHMRMASVVISYLELRIWRQRRPYNIRDITFKH